MDNIEFSIDNNTPKQKDNFSIMEEKLSEIIGSCSSKNLVGTYVENGPFGITDVGHATSIKHYELENGLHVYVFYDFETPINYLFANKKIYKEEFHGLDSRLKYLGGAALQYTMGGRGNSIPIDRLNRFFSSKAISAVGPDYDGKLGVEVSMVALKPLNGNVLGSFKIASSDHTPRTEEDLKESYSKGDLEGFFTSFKFAANEKNPRRESVLEELKQIFAKVNELNISRHVGEPEDKRGILRRLLAEFDSLKRLTQSLPKERRGKR